MGKEGKKGGGREDIDLYKKGLTKWLEKYLSCMFLRKSLINFSKWNLQKVWWKVAFFKKKKVAMGWRNGSVVKSTSCNSRGPTSNFQYPHGSSQLSFVTLFPDNLMPFSSLHKHQAYIWFTEKHNRHKIRKF